MSAPHAVPTLRCGDQLGRYQLLVAVAMGGMGQVWAARQIGVRGFQKVVAIKVAHAELAGPHFERLFLDEARLAASIQHPNVCSILELGEVHGLLYLVMEWVGCSVHDFTEAIADHKLGPRTAARILTQACAGLHAAHELRDDAGAPLHVVHRDVSPHNFLLMPSGHVKISDFGIAHARNQSHEATATGAIKGKVSYMAPEQFTSRSFDRRVDIFASGCVLYELSLGTKPFPSNGLETIYRIVEGTFDRPSALEASFPAELEEIILRAMALDPADRYQTADAMRTALESYLASSGPPCSESDIAAIANAAMGEQLARRADAIRMAASTLDDNSSIRSVDNGVSVPIAVRTSPAVAVLQESFVASDKVPSPAASSWHKPLFGAVGALAVVAGSVLGALRGGTPRFAVSERVFEGARPEAPIYGSEGALAKADAATKSVEIEIATTPPGATLFVDGKPALSNPYRVTVSEDPVRHVFRASAPNYEDAVETITYLTSQRVVLALKPRRASGLARPTVSPVFGHVDSTAKADSRQEVVPSVAPFAKTGDVAEPVPRRRPRRTLDSTDPFQE